MKRTLPVLAVCVGTALFAAGCTKTSEPPPPVAPKQASPAPGTSIVPPMPDANVPKGAEAPSPKPGQAGDHSTPAFKDGGKKDPNK